MLDTFNRDFCRETVDMSLTAYGFGNSITPIEREEIIDHVEKLMKEVRGGVENESAG